MASLSNFGRQTPPAVFTVILGLFGLTLAWRAAARISIVPTAVFEMLLGAVSALFAVAALAYTVKFLRRPSSMIEDMRILPGRGGLAASAVCYSVLAAGLVPLMPEMAQKLMTFAFVFHTALACAVGYVLLTGPVEQRRVTPLFHLSFVGFIVVAVSAVGLGHYGFAQAVYWSTMCVALLVWGVSAIQLLKTTPPAPLRPLLAIHLAPASLFGIVALGFPSESFPMMPLAANPASALAFAIFGALLLKLRWIMEAGFSPLWGAFTFPLTAFATLFLSLAAETDALFPKVIGVFALVAATFFVPWIAMKVVQMWMKGSLAVKTNAAKA